MPPLFNQGTHPLAAAAVASAPQAGGRSAFADAGASRTSGSAPAPASPPASAPADSVRLSSRALAALSQQDGTKSTLDVAREFAQDFAAEVFGEAARFDADDITLDNASVQSLPADFNTADISTRDGHRFQVEIEARYQVKVDAPIESTLIGKSLPAIKYPGTLDDLFKVLGRQLSAEDQDQNRLTLRLIRLVDRAALLAPRMKTDEPASGPAARRFAASAYASAPALASLSDD